MDKQAVLTALKSYAEEHLILDHKDHYELKDHRWHARELLVKGQDGDRMVDGLFDRSELGDPRPVNQALAAHLPHLPHLGLRLDVSRADGHPDHGYRLEVDDPDKLQAALFHSTTDDERFSTASHQVGHLLGTLEGLDVNARSQGGGGWNVPEEVYGEVGAAAIKGNPQPYDGPNNLTNALVNEDFLARLRNVKTGMVDGLKQQASDPYSPLRPQRLQETHTDEELRGKLRALDEDDWRWHNNFIHTAPVDPDEFEEFFDEKTNVDPNYLKTEGDVDNAYEVLMAAGADESTAADWADEKKQKLNSAPTSVAEVDDWLDNEHNHSITSVPDVIDGESYLDSGGTDPDVIADWIATKLNFNTSEGGAVSDHSYDDRPFDPQQAVAGAREVIAQAHENEFASLAYDHSLYRRQALGHVAQWPDPEEYRQFRISQLEGSHTPEQLAAMLPTTIPNSVDETYMTQDAEYRAGVLEPEELPDPGLPDPATPAATMLSTPVGQAAFFRAVNEHDQFDGDGMGWDSDTTTGLYNAKKDWDRLPPEDRARRYADAARFIDRSAEAPLMVFSDDAHKASTWLQDGAYKYTRYTTVPGGDGHTRTEREDEMGIGRVNYAAHGFDAPLPPILGDGRGSNFFPVDDIHGECADFRTMGYGNARFMFDYPDTPVSHAVSDTYMDARFCPDGGWRALLANAPAFAETQADYKGLANPSQGSHKLAGSGHEIPTFVELHPKDLPASGLRSVQLREFRASPDALSLTNAQMLQDVLTYSDASVTVTPTGAKFYPPDYEHRREYPGAGTMYNYELVTGPYNNVLPWSEQEARDQIDKAQEHLQQTYGDRVKLYVPKWARR